MASIGTPSWNSKLLAEKDVYEPAEDTFLLLDALEEDIDSLTSLKPIFIIEIGAGSGVIISAVATVFKSKVHCLAIDINKNACQMIKDTAHLNNVQVDVVHGDLLNSLDLREIADIIIFNPPYVETSEEEASVAGITQSWAGGESGTKIVDRLLPVVNKALSTGGMFYLVAIDYNDINKICCTLKNFSMEGSILKKKQIRGELLYVLKFIKVSNPS